MLLIMRHPEVATRSCEFCQKVLHDNHGKPLETRMHTDEQPDYVLRDASCPPECRTKKGCPKGTPENSNALTEANWLAYEHYRECRAVGQFPDDPIVRRNAAVIRDIEDRVEKTEQQTRQLEMTNLVMLTAAKRQK